MEYEIKITGSGTLQQLKDALAAIAANIDINEDYSDGYEDEGPYLMTEIATYNEDEGGREDEDGGWVCTDIDTNQYRRKLDTMVFEFKEDRVIDPVIGKVGEFQAIIDVDLYSLDEILEACSAFGYSKEDVRKWWKDESNWDLIAECIFELKT